jgi:protein-disulfide isomerase
MMKDVPRPRATLILAAVLGVSVGLNVLLFLRAHHPQLWHEIALLVMTRPPVPRADDHVRGQDLAPVTVVEYSDFQCPFCAEIHSSLRRLAEEGKIKWIYRNFPLSSVHPTAIKAAEAAECAGEQSRFWEYADALFESQQQLQTNESGSALLTSLANRLSLDEKRFRECTASQRFEGRIRSQITEANSLQVDSTPTLFVNGKRQVGSLSFEQLDQLVQSRRR